MTERDRWIVVSVLGLVAMIALTVLTIRYAQKGGMPETHIEQTAR